MEIIEIIPKELYASGSLDKKAWKMIKVKRITAIINLRTIKDNPPKSFPKKLLFWMPLSMLGVPKTLWLMRVTNRIIRLLHQGHRVLIHCNLGKHRTGLVIAAYYMRRYQLSPDSALNKARQTKPDLNLPFHFMAALNRFEKHLKNS